MSWGWVAYIACLWFGWRLGLRAGFSASDYHWVKHLEKHGWKLEEDEDDPEGPGRPVQMYADYWYKQRERRDR